MGWPVYTYTNIAPRMIDDESLRADRQFHARVYLPLLLADISAQARGYSRLGGVKSFKTRNISFIDLF